MSRFTKQLTPFNGVGKLLGFVVKDNQKIKYLRVAISDQEYWVKPVKGIRKRLESEIVPGCLVEINGYSKPSLKTGKLKYIAEAITSLEGELETKGKQREKGCVLICQKPDCWKGGGEAICQYLEWELRDRGLREIEIRKTGCLKKCKKGPNLVFLPDKAKYSHVKKEEVSSLLDRHF